MSDQSQGPGWWQASDGKWYPPEQAPGYQPAGGAPYGGGAGNADAGTSLSYAFNKFTANIGELLVLWLIIFGVQIVFWFISNIAGGGAMRMGFGSGFLASTAIGIVQWMITGVLYVALAKAALMIAEGRKVDIAECFQLSGPPLIAGLVFGAIIGIGLALCVLPGIVAYFLLAFTPIVAAAQNRGADALGEAFGIASADFGNSFLLLLVVGLLSACTCGLGAPIGMIALAHNYKAKRGEPIAP